MFSSIRFLVMRWTLLGLAQFLILWQSLTITSARTTDPMSSGKSLHFVEYSDSNSDASKHIIKSQAARHHWAENAEIRKRRRTKRDHRHAASKRYTIVLETTEDDSNTAIEFFEKSSSAEMGLRILLGAGCQDPFDSYPIPREPFFPELIDHYIVKMAVDIPEIDGPGRKGLLRFQWFPLVMSDPGTFLTVLLLSASHLYSLHEKHDAAVVLLRLKGRAIQTINEGVADLSKTESCKIPSDSLISAVAKMCSYEAMYGNLDSYSAHMQGLQQLIEMRGGLSSLGLDGLLRRICLWIDMNSAHLHNISRFFVGHSLNHDGTVVEPNPGHFIGSID